MNFSNQDVEQLLLRVLQQYGPSVSPTRSIVNSSTGFSGANVWKVTTDERIVAVRRWPKAGWTPQRVGELHRYLAFLLGQGLPVAVPLAVAGQNGSLVLLDEHLWQVEPWLPGETRNAETLGDDERRSMMHTLARFHLVSEHYRADPLGQEWFRVGRGKIPAVRERLAFMEQWNERKLRECMQSLSTAPEALRSVGESMLSQFVRMAATIHQELMNASILDCQLFPCWRDLWSDHVLFEANAVSGLLDPAATRFDHPATDISRLLGSMFGDDRAKWKLALDDYQQVRKLPIVDQLMVKTLDRSGVLLSGMTWLHRWQVGNFPNDRVDDIVPRLQVIESRMLKLS